MEQFHFSSHFLPFLHDEAGKTALLVTLSLISEEQVIFGNLSRLRRSVLFEIYRQTHNAMDFDLLSKVNHMPYDQD